MRRVLLATCGLIAVCGLFLVSGASGSRTNDVTPQLSAIAATPVATPHTPTLMGDPNPVVLPPQRNAVIEASVPVNRTPRDVVPPLLFVSTPKTPILFADLKPQQVRLDFDAEHLIVYKKKAKTVSFRPDELLQRELLMCLATHGIPEYPADKVHEYLVAQADKQRKIFDWVPLRETDAERWRKQGGQWTPRDSTRNGNGWVRSEGHYAKLVPQEVLERVQVVESYVPESVFYVSDIEKFKDPFLAVGVPGHPLIVIAVWDEPGFTCPPLARVPELIVRK